VSYMSAWSNETGRRSYLETRQEMLELMRGALSVAIINGQADIVFQMLIYGSAVIVKTKIVAYLDKRYPSSERSERLSTKMKKMDPPAELGKRSEKG